jgi:hypothetical protein
VSNPPRETDTAKQLKLAECVNNVNTNGRKNRDDILLAETGSGGRALLGLPTPCFSPATDMRARPAKVANGQAGAA